MPLPPSPPGIPPNCAENFERLLAFPLDTPERILQAVDRHMHNVSLALAEHPHINLVQAREIAAQLKKLLSYGPDTSELHQQWIQAAARYFFLNDDGDHDWASQEGFEDDAAVVRVVALAIGG